MPSDASDHVRILFVCTANISRSPYLELVAHARAGEEPGVTFSSAGVYARNDTLVDPGMAVELTARGISSEDFRSRRLTPSLVDEADLVLTAEAAHRAAILDEHPTASRKVLTVGQADRALDRLDPSLGRVELPAALVAARGGATADLDIVDPYRQGPAAARACAQILDVVVDRLLARLTADAPGPAR